MNFWVVLYEFKSLLNDTLDDMVISCISKIYAFKTQNEVQNMH
jgi:hypothetical protein